MIARDVDHLIVRVHEPESLFRFFSQTLGLPVDWEIGGNQAFTSGFVYLGNVSVEFVRFDPALPFALPEATLADIGGVVFHPPPLDEALPGLDAAQLKYLPPDSAESQHGDEIARWQSVVLLDLLTGRHDPFYFLCRYDHDVIERRARLRMRFDAAAGGVLGVDRLKEVVIQTPRIDAFRSVFDRLVGPSRGDDLWQLGAGPAVRLRGSDEHRIGPLIFAVQSVAHTTQVLRELGIGQTVEEGVRVDPAAVAGLALRFEG